MQGTAGGYFLAKWGNADQVIMADVDLGRAERAASWINRLMGKEVARPAACDASKKAEVVTLLSTVNSCFSATSYELNLAITEAAIEAKVNLIDLGGNTDVVWKQIKLHEKALMANITVVPDTGLAPGLGNTLAALGISRLDSCDEVQIRCGGLPQTPRPPLNYKLVFSVKGLTNEYFGKASIIRNSEIQSVDTFQELESLEFDAPVGPCEAFTTSGGTSTAPWTFKGKVKTYEYKTVRYPGHYDKMKCMLDLGLLDDKPVQIGHQSVVPRDVFHAVAPQHLSFPEDKDLVVLRTVCKGLKNNRPAQIQFDLMDFHDEKSGFSAMERSTAYPAALVLIHATKGLTKKGVVPLESAVDNEAYFKELTSQAFPIKEKTTQN